MKTRRKKPLGKSASKSTGAIPAVGRPQPLRVLEKALANAGHASESTPLFDNAPGETPLDRAQELVYQAWEIPNPAKRISLAKQALTICPDCADAHMLLAQEQSLNPEDAIECFQCAVEAGERAVGTAAFENDVGYFWGILRTRPYMRARWALASALWVFGERSNAIAHAQDMLRLNPNDNQGVRYILISWLLQSRRLSDARALWKQYEGDSSAVWAWSLALMAFIEHGDHPPAGDKLGKAIAVNPHLPALLLGREALPADAPEFIGRGDSDEAIAYVFDNLELWQQTHGALRWLSRTMPIPRRNPATVIAHMPNVGKDADFAGIRAIKSSDKSN
jgi:tetratricopeptide (TPR) repeat protein